jgi:hypothetical protein
LRHARGLRTPRITFSYLMANISTVVAKSIDRAAMLGA